MNGKLRCLLAMTMGSASGKCLTYEELADHGQRDGERDLLVRVKQDDGHREAAGPAQDEGAGVDLDAAEVCEGWDDDDTGDNLDKAGDEQWDVDVGADVFSNEMP